MDPEFQQLSTQLAALAIRNTAASVTDRIASARARKRDQETINELEALVDDLVAEKAELYRIAYAYEQELVAQRISDADVEYITTSVLPILERVLISAGGGQAEQARQMLDILRPLISTDSVKVLQLLGFNFRRALGEPLTELVSAQIAARVPAPRGGDVNLEALQMQHQTEVLRVAQDPAAVARLDHILGRSPRPDGAS